MVDEQRHAQPACPAACPRPPATAVPADHGRGDRLSVPAPAPAVGVDLTRNRTPFITAANPVRAPITTNTANTSPPAAAAPPVAPPPGRTRRHTPHRRRLPLEPHATSRTPPAPPSPRNEQRPLRRPACDSPSHWNPAGQVVHGLALAGPLQRLAAGCTNVASVTTIDGNDRNATSAPLIGPEQRYRPAPPPAPAAATAPAAPPWRPRRRRRRRWRTATRSRCPRAGPAAPASCRPPPPAPGPTAPTRREELAAVEERRPARPPSTASKRDVRRRDGRLAAVAEGAPSGALIRNVWGGHRIALTMGTILGAPGPGRAQPACRAANASLRCRGHGARRRLRRPRADTARLC